MPIPSSLGCSDTDDSALLDLVQQSDTLIELLHGFFQKLDVRRSQDFEAIAGYIAETKAEIRDLRPQAAAQSSFPTAGAELHAISQDTEVATNTIMSAAEAMMDMDVAAEGLKDRVDDEVMKIFEACSFQDITGQRVAKIVKVLTQIDALISRLGQAVGDLSEEGARELTAAEKRNRDLLLNGPAIGGPETRQADIDDLFATPDAAEEAGLPNSQDDIDALFA